MRLQALDLARFIAAFAVVLYHYTARAEHNSFPELAQITQFGYLGVPLFFMISGFVIAASAERRNPLQFMIARAARLYPAFWAGIIITTIILLLTESARITTPQFLANLTMLNDYLGIANVDGVYWTLQAELKFYACVFLLLCLGIFTKYHWWLPIWLLLAITYLTLGHPSKLGWFINPGYSFYFISGVGFYLLSSNQLTRLTTATLIISSAMCTYQAYQQAPGFMAAGDPIDFVIAAIAVGLFHLFFILLALNKLQIKESAIYTVLGGITYPLYLIHNRAGKALIDKFSTSISEPAAILLTTMGMLVTAYLIYKFIEPGGSKLLKSQLTTLTNRLFSPITNKIKAP